MDSQSIRIGLAGPHPLRAGFPTPWSLPGPAAFVAQTSMMGNRDRVLVLHAPAGVGAFVEALGGHLVSELGYAVRMLSQKPGDSFLVALAHECGLPHSSPASLAASPSLRHTALLVVCHGGLEDDLATYARLVRRQPTSDGRLLFIIDEDGECHLDDCSAVRIRDVSSPLDGAAYAAAMPRATRPLEMRLVASIAIDVAAWDVSLIDYLMALPIENAVRPDLCIPQWDDGRLSRWRGTPADWARGSLDLWGGEEFEHALWLAG